MFSVGSRTIEKGRGHIQFPRSIFRPWEICVGGNSRTTFSKRQKERARQEKQAEKAQRKAQRRTQQGDVEPSEKQKDLVVAYDDEGQPQGFDFHDF